MLGKVGLPELAIILVIVIMIFGPKRLPQFGKALGETLASFKGVKKQLRELHEDGEEIVEKVSKSVRE